MTKYIARYRICEHTHLVFGFLPNGIMADKREYRFSARSDQQAKKVALSNRAKNSPQVQRGSLKELPLLRTLYRVEDGRNVRISIRPEQPERLPVPERE